MGAGAASVGTFQKIPVASAPFGPSNVLADQGLSLNPSPPAGDVEIEFGDRLGAGTFNSRLTTNRQLDLNQFAVLFDLFGDSLSAGGFEAIGFGNDTGTLIAGININTNYDIYDPTVFAVCGYAINDQFTVTNMGWFRGIGNDNFVFGDSFVGGINLFPAPRFIFWDSGNLTFNSQAGSYPNTQDIDTGIGFQRFPNGGTESITDFATGDAINITVPGTFVEAFINEVDWSVRLPIIVVDNQNSSFGISGSNAAALGGDIGLLSFHGSPPINEGNIQFLLSGNIQVFNQVVFPKIADLP